jgi:hypothetical protein
MNLPDTTLGIKSLGRFSIFVNVKPVATNWPDETVKVFFYSLLSPMDLSYTWDRLCLSILGVGLT